MVLRARDRAELESRFPDRFTDGQKYVDLARRASDLGYARYWESSEWEGATGQQRPRGERRLWAPALYAVYSEYEAERLSGRWLSAAGIDKINAARDELNAIAPTLRDPRAVTRYKIESWFLDQADRDPDRRLPLSSAIKQLDLVAVVPRGRPFGSSG